MGKGKRERRGRESEEDGGRKEGKKGRDRMGGARPPQNI